MRDEGFLKYLPLSGLRDGKASDNRDKSEDLPYFSNSELSGRKARIADTILFIISLKSPVYMKKR